MKAFTKLFKSLDETTKTTSKVKALGEYFATAQGPDKVWTIALLSHRRPRRTINTRLLRKWAAEEAGIPLWLFEESYHVVGDLAETVTLVVANKTLSDKSLTYWINQIIALSEKSEEEKKAFITSAWEQLTTVERFVFNKVITGNFRVGVSQKIMVRGLAIATGIDENTLAYQIAGEWDPSMISYEALIYPNENEKDVSKPYPFYLAYALEKDLAALGKPSEWQAEYKWDGVRGQLIRREGLLFLWSRGEELITERFPEFEAVREKLPDGTVIDGEILAWKQEKVMDFNHLQARIGRKNVTEKILKQVPVVLMAYDLLEMRGKDLRTVPLQERRAKLEQLVAQADNPVLRLSEVLNFTQWSQLDKEKARVLNAEGLILKRKPSPYEVGRKKGNWWKWKVDPYKIDAVLIYAMRGHGRRSNLYTDYTFGLWREGELVTFAKAYSGLTDAEIRQVDHFIKCNTLERFGPVRMVEPKLVFELAFEGIAKSKRHKSGYAVRFPRIHRWRQDKVPGEANSLKDLEQLVSAC